MSLPTTFLVVFGTRPSAIKLAPVVKALKERKADVKVVCTDQHTFLATQACESVGLTVDEHLNIFNEGQTLSEIVALTLLGLPKFLDHRDAVVTVGDTSSAVGAALAGFHAQVPVAHVEAGLRSYDRDDPFPEEANRVIVDALSTWHFAPTATAAENIGDEMHAGNVRVVGNTVIDAVRSVPDCDRIMPEGEYILVTAHRRENWPRMDVLCGAVADVAKQSGLRVAWVHHGNPSLRRRIEFLLHDDQHVFFMPPMPYHKFLGLVRHSALVMSDSGGVQEECAALGRHCVVMRDTTERGEAIAAGIAVLAGVDRDRIAKAAMGRLAMEQPKPSDCFGDGRAAERIADILTTGHTPLGDWLP